MGPRPNLPNYKCDRTMYSTLCVFPECALRRCHAACLICIVLDIDLLVRNLPVTEYRKLRRWTIQYTSTWTVQPSSRLAPIDSSPYYWSDRSERQIPVLGDSPDITSVKLFTQRAKLILTWSNYRLRCDQNGGGQNIWVEGCRPKTIDIALRSWPGWTDKDSSWVPFEWKVCSP